MNEEHKAKLDEMFPDGYLIMFKAGEYIDATIYNPNNFEALENWRNTVAGSKLSS